MLREFDGANIVPYDREHNSTGVYVRSRDLLFAATVTDLRASDALIYRRHLRHQDTTKDSLEQLRTANRWEILNGVAKKCF